MLLNDSVRIFVGDKSALRPSGLRFGSPALTSRGMVQDDFKKVAEFIHRGNPKKHCLVCPDLLWLMCLHGLYKFKRLSLIILTFLFIGILLALEVQGSLDPKAPLKDFIQALKQGEKFKQRVAEIRTEVEAFASQFPMPGLPEL